MKDANLFPLSALYIRDLPPSIRLAYIEKIKTETEGIEAFMGSRVHDALEKLYRDLKVTKLNTLMQGTAICPFHLLLNRDSSCPPPYFNPCFYAKDS